MAKQAIKPANLGAWVFKCAPAVWSLSDFVADGNRYIESWSVRESYRLDLFEPGQRAILWATAGHPGFESGVVGHGTVTGEFFNGTGSEYWVDRKRAKELRAFAEMDMELLERCVTREEFKTDPVLAGAEIIRQPQMSNPSYLDVKQIAALDRLLGR